MKLTNKTIGLKSEASIAAGATLDTYAKPVRISSVYKESLRALFNFGGII